jgi:hypothetical protein
MKISDITEPPRKKKTKAPMPPQNAAWDSLMRLKEEAARTGEMLARRPQLFVPRGMRILGPREKQIELLKRAWFWDDEGNLKPEYQKYDESMREAAPILKPGRAISKVGSNKPVADLWTSSARKLSDGYTSQWVEWVRYNMPKWHNDVGHLYQVKPGALVLELRSNYDFREILDVFAELHDTPKLYDTDTYQKYTDDEMALRTHMPWDKVAFHFDGVHVSGNSGYGDMTYGWDVESTAWLNTDMLVYKGQVNISKGQDDEDY